MGQYNTGVLTTAGQQLITQALAGDGIISFPLAKTSSWAIPAGTNIQALTDLQDIQQTVTPGTAQIFNGTMIQVQALFSNANQGSEVTEAYLVQTVGLWAQITGGEPTLFSVYQATTPDQMPAYAGKAPSSLIYTFQATVQQASQLTVQVNPAGAATALDIQNLQTQITQIENDYIPKTQIGAASGVAGLGSNSAVPIAQGGTGGTTITEALANLGAQPGFNLLVNSRFKYNGRNQSSYSTTGSVVYTVDGWYISCARIAQNTELQVIDGGITFSSTVGSKTADFRQVIENFLQKTYTFSVYVSSAASFRLWANNNSSTIGYQDIDLDGAGVATFTFTPTAQGSGFVALQLRSGKSSSVTLTAAKLELGSVSTLATDLAQGQDEAVEQLRLDLYDLDPGRPAWVLTQNENLLDNWYFVGGGSQQGGGQFPINQRGQASYTGTGYGIDRWKAGDSSQTISVLANGISILNSSGNSEIFQTIAQNLINQKVTFSVQQSDGTIDILTNTFTGSGTQIIHQMTNGKGQIYLSDGASESGVGILASSGETVTITAAKLELGTRSTLARLVDGEWVLNDPPPNFQQELAKCQRYQRFIRANGAYSPFWSGGSSSNAVFFRAYGVQMRITPTLTASGNFILRGNGETVPLSGNKWGAVGANEPTISASGLSGITANQIYQLLSYNDTDAYILLDANL